MKTHDKKVKIRRRLPEASALTRCLRPIHGDYPFQERDAYQGRDIFLGILIGSHHHAPESLLSSVGPMMNFADHCKNLQFILHRDIQQVPSIELLSRVSSVYAKVTN